MTDTEAIEAIRAILAEEDPDADDTTDDGWHWMNWGLEAIEEVIAKVRPGKD